MSVTIPSADTTDKAYALQIYQSRLGPLTPLDDDGEDLWKRQVTPGEAADIFIRQFPHANIGFKIVSDSTVSVLQATHDLFPRNIFESEPISIPTLLAMDGS